MAANDQGQAAIAAVLAALNTMQSNVASKDKVEAHEFLEKFQKSVGTVVRSARRCRTDI